MLVNVASQGKCLVESGVYNAPFSSVNDVVIRFNYIGLQVRLIFQVFIGVPGVNAPATLPDFSAALEQNVVVLKQFFYFNDQQVAPWGYAGMLVPLEIGIKPDGKKIFLSWKVDFARSMGGVLMAVTHYSFYEEE